MTVDGALAYQESGRHRRTGAGDDCHLRSRPFQHLGFATDFNAPLWAMFSTGDAGPCPSGLYARTNNGADVLQNHDDRRRVATAAS